MPNENPDLPPPVNHVFVDFENVQDIDLSIIGSKTVHFTLLMGARQTKLDAALVEKLLRHAVNVELVRLQSSGRNALDFALTYYVGRAVAADPVGYFHIVSKDGGFDPLIEHLRSKHIRIRRHEDFATLTLTAPAKPAAALPPTTPPPPPPAAKATSPAQTKPVPPRAWSVDEQEQRVLENLRKPTTKRPGTRKRLVSYVIAHLGKKITATEAEQLIDLIRQAGHLVIGDNGKVTYHLNQS